MKKGKSGSLKNKNSSFVSVDLNDDFVSKKIKKYVYEPFMALISLMGGLSSYVTLSDGKHDVWLFITLGVAYIVFTWSMLILAFHIFKKRVVVIILSVFLLIVLPYHVIPTIMSKIHHEKEVCAPFPSPIPKVDPKKFTVLIACLENDISNNSISIIMKALRQRIQEIAVEPLGRSITGLRLGTSGEVEGAREKAREYLKETGAQVLIWGAVDEGEGKGVQLYMEASETQPQETTRDYMFQDITIEKKFDDDFLDVLSMVIATQHSKFEKSYGKYVEDNLSVFVDRVRKLLKTNHFSIKKEIEIRTYLGQALLSLGDKEGDIDALEEAKDIFKYNVKVLSNIGDQDNWATEQLGLGNSFMMLGEKTADVKFIYQAIIAYNEAIEILSQYRNSPGFVLVQSLLGDAFSMLSTQINETKLLYRAVAAYKGAIESFSSETSQRDRAMVQCNLGSAFLKIGTRTNDINFLNQAIDSYKAAIEVFSREKFPFLCAMAQTNMGSALEELGTQTANTELINQAVNIQMAALEACPREKVPSYWASVQNNLGNALRKLGKKNKDIIFLNKSVAAYNKSLEVWTINNLPFSWAMAKNNLGNALFDLGKIESKVDKINQAIGSHLDAWSFYASIGSNEMRLVFSELCTDIIFLFYLSDSTKPDISKHSGRLAEVSLWAKENGLMFPYEP